MTEEQREAVNYLRNTGGNIIGSMGGIHKQRCDAISKLIEDGYCMMCGGERDLNGTCCSTCVNEWERKREEERLAYEAYKNRPHDFIGYTVMFIIFATFVGFFIAMI